MTRTVTILSLVLALVLVGCESTPKAPGAANEEAAVEMSPKAQLLEQIDRKYENPEAHYQLGKLSYAEGQLDKADFEYRVALGFNPVHYRAQAGVVRWRRTRSKPNEPKSSRNSISARQLYPLRRPCDWVRHFRTKGLVNMR